MLKNPVYTGRIVWNRLDFTEAKHAGGGARHRAREEWVIAEEAHLPLVSDEVFAAAQGRFDQTVRSQNSVRANREYLFSGMVRCCTGHQSLSMHGKARKGPHYYTCAYSTSYGASAALEAHGGQSRYPFARTGSSARAALLRATDLRADALRQARQAATRP